jgi:hypothetical protein
LAPVQASAETDFQSLFDGTEKTFKQWKLAGPGGFALVDGMLVAQPGLPNAVDGVKAPVGPHTVIYYAPEAFNDFVLRLQFRLAGPATSSGKPVDNSGVFVRFHAPHSTGSDLPTNNDVALQNVVASNPAWVAAYTGFEIQIDEHEAPDGADKHRTGAIYNVPTTPAGMQNFTSAAPLQVGVWNDMEISVSADRSPCSSTTLKQPTSLTRKMTWSWMHRDYRCAFESCEQARVPCRGTSGCKHTREM